MQLRRKDAPKPSNSPFSFIDDSREDNRYPYWGTDKAAADTGQAALGLVAFGPADIGQADIGPESIDRVAERWVDSTRWLEKVAAVPMHLALQEGNLPSVAVDRGWESGSGAQEDWQIANSPSMIPEQ